MWPHGLEASLYQARKVVEFINGKISVRQQSRRRNRAPISERTAGVQRVVPRSVEGGKSQAGRSIAGGDGSGTLALIAETAGPCSGCI